MPELSFREHPAAPALGPWLASYWCFRAVPGPEPRTHAVIPDGCISLVWIRAPERRPGRVLVALGVITREAATGTYRMRAFRADGHMVDTVIEIGADSYRWGFEDPRAGRIRYTVRFSGDTWEEEGEISRDDGATWMPFMAMKLTRVR